MSAREAIFGAIERAIGPAGDAASIRAAATTLLAEPERVRPILPDEPDITLFEAAVKRLPPGASCERVATMAAVPETVAARLRSLALAPTLKVQPHPALIGLDWVAAKLVPGPDVDDRVSVSLAETGIAETATLVLRSGPQMPILDAFLPLHHIAVLRASDIVRHLDDAFGKADLKRSRNLVLVTGPSGTTDIEGSLVIGVHGPATLHILIVEGD